MSEAIWLAGSALPKSSRESPQDWVQRFLGEARVRPEWITCVQAIQNKTATILPTWNLPVLASSWIGGAGQAHALLGWVCAEVRAGKQDLALLLEKEPEGWDAALLAPPAFFGSRNRIPGVALLETRTFNHPDAEKALAEQSNFLIQHGLSPLPDGDPAGFSAGWADPGGWYGTRGILAALNAAARLLETRSAGKSALRTGGENTPAMVTILEAL
jgi:hypothetical protein